MNKIMAKDITEEMRFSMAISSPQLMEMAKMFGLAYLIEVVPDASNAGTEVFIIDGKSFVLVSMMLGQETIIRFFNKTLSALPVQDVEL